MKKIIILIIVLFYFSNVRASILLDFPHYNSRLYGSGESMLIVKRDFNNISIFPASISDIENQILSMGIVKWSNMVSIINIGYVHNLKALGVIGGTINYGALKEITNYDEQGNVLGTLKNNELLLNIGYGRKIKNNIQTGMNIKYLYMNTGGYTGTWIGAGLSGIISVHLKSINIKTRENLNLGLGIQDINLIKATFNKKSSGYPTTICGGYTYKFLNISDIEMATGSTYYFMTKYNKHYVSTGLELGYLNLFYLRSGFYIFGRDSDKINIGMSISKDNLLNIKSLETVIVKFDYSLSFLDEGTVHFVQLSFVFNPD